MSVVVSLLACLSFAEQEASPPPSTPAANSPSQSASSSNAIALGEPVQWVSPKYPNEALKQKLQGLVVLDLLVKKDGTVKSVSVISGAPVLADAATHAIRKWRYVPYFQDGQPVEVQTAVTISFKISDTGRPDISAKYIEPKESPLSQVFEPGNGVSAPKALYAPDPGYSKEARKSNFQGTCSLSLVVDADGRPRNIQITKSLGKGLDEKAIDAVRQWRFAPATKEGKPVAVHISVDITFRVY